MERSFKTATEPSELSQNPSLARSASISASFFSMAGTSKIAPELFGFFEQILDYLSGFRAVGGGHFLLPDKLYFFCRISSP